jgi:uridine kinase
VRQPSKSIIAVDGIDGSGKSTFARRLFAELNAQGCTAVIVSVDDFRRPIDWSTVEGSEADAYWERYYDLNLAESCLRSFVLGMPGLTIPRYDVTSERIEGERDLVFEGTAVAIVEGVFPLRIPSVNAGMLIYLEASETEARRRIIERDQQKQRTREAIERRIDLRYFPSQERYRTSFTPRTRADVIIDNQNPTAPRALKRDLARVPAFVRAALDRFLPASGDEPR